MHFYFLGYGLNRFVNGSFYRLSIETAVRIYYEYNAIGNKQICELFGCCIGKAQQLKKPVAVAMLEKGMYLRGTVLSVSRSHTRYDVLNITGFFTEMSFSLRSVGSFIAEKVVL